MYTIFFKRILNFGKFAKTENGIRPYIHSSVYIYLVRLNIGTYILMPGINNVA